MVLSPSPQLFSSHVSLGIIAEEDDSSTEAISEAGEDLGIVTEEEADDEAGRGAGLVNFEEDEDEDEDEDDEAEAEEEVRVWRELIPVAVLLRPCGGQEVYSRAVRLAITLMITCSSAIWLGAPCLAMRHSVGAAVLDDNFLLGHILCHRR